MAQVTAGTATIDAGGLETREVNRAMKGAIADGATEIRVLHPAGRHSLGVALKADGVRIVFDGPVGWYAAGMNHGPAVVVEGSAGWAVGECMMSGRIEVHGFAGSGAAASIRGGLVYVNGDTGARAGIAMKGGTLIVAGSVGYMTGFMMQKGTIIVCGDAADGLGDSLYDGTIYVGGKVKSLGIDCVPGEWTDADTELIERKFRIYGLGSPPEFQKFVCGKKLYNYDNLEPSERKLVL